VATLGGLPGSGEGHDSSVISARGARRGRTATPPPPHDRLVICRRVCWMWGWRPLRSQLTVQWCSTSKRRLPTGGRARPSAPPRPLACPSGMPLGRRRPGAVAFAQASPASAGRH
jgi:hypothetical protein